MILVVDDDPEVLEQAQKILNRDRQVFLASNATQAYDMVKRLGFSVVLVDLDLPQAYSLIQRLQDTHPDLLIIAISGAMQASVADTTKLGVAEVLNKPISPAWKPVVERVRARRFGT
ncbi:MAG TPA: response regulator [Bryobacteraceae bacterium]|jgi:DNA-binding NtrC family response regulator|nr:response regulator [Bryobacteraceae bacterium]